MGLGLALMGMASGCATRRLPHPERTATPGLTVPATWTQASPSNAGPAAPGWIADFEDPSLVSLIGEALARNRNLGATAARLKAAREGVVLGRAGRLPSLGAGASGNHTQTSFRDNQGDLQPFLGADDLRFSLTASWEVDLWGRLAHGHRATIADFQGRQADYDAARLSLAANTAKAWFNLTAARQQVTLAEQTRDSFVRNQRIVERNFKAGDLAASPLDVQFARNQLAAAERGLIQQRLALDEARRSLELLLGRYPATGVDGRPDLPLVTHDIPAGLPSDLLMRRPDLVEAAADLRASAERADAARKGLLPSITLTAGGSAGAASIDLLDIVGDPTFLAGSLAASLAQPLYRGGALRAQARQALAFNEAAVETFAAVALRAFREVESALAAEQSLAGQYAFLETEVRQANLAEIQATRDYSEGIVGYLSVLEAQRRAFNARSAMIGMRNARLQNRIDLHLALGGDFSLAAGAGTPTSRDHE